MLITQTNLKKIWCSHSRSAGDHIVGESCHNSRSTADHDSVAVLIWIRMRGTHLLLQWPYRLWSWIVVVLLSLILWLAEIMRVLVTFASWSVNTGRTDLLCGSLPLSWNRIKWSLSVQRRSPSQWYNGRLPLYWIKEINTRAAVICTTSATTAALTWSGWMRPGH